MTNAESIPRFHTKDFMSLIVSFYCSLQYFFQGWKRWKLKKTDGESKWHFFVHFYNLVLISMLYVQPSSRKQNIFRNAACNSLTVHIFLLMKVVAAENNKEQFPRNLYECTTIISFVTFTFTFPYNVSRRDLKMFRLHFQNIRKQFSLGFMKVFTKYLCI